MTTRIYFEGEYIEANQIWIFRPRYGYVKIYIVKEVVSEQKIYVFGLASPLELIDFYRLHRVKYISLMPREIRRAINHDMKKFGLRHLLYPSSRLVIALTISLIITLIFLYLTLPL